MEEYEELMDSLDNCLDLNITTVKINKCSDNTLSKIDKLFLGNMYRELAILSLSSGDLDIAKEYLKAGIDNCKCHNCGC